MAWVDLDGQIGAAQQQTMAYYDKQFIPDLRQEHAAALETARNWTSTLAGLVSSLAGSILELLPANDTRRAMALSSVVTVDALGETAIHAFPDAIATVVAQQAAVDGATIVELNRSLTTARAATAEYSKDLLVVTIRGLANLVAGSLPADHKLTAQLIDEELDPIQTVGVMAEALDEREMAFEALRNQNASGTSTDTEEPSYRGQSRRQRQRWSKTPRGMTTQLDGSDTDDTE